MAGNSPNLKVRATMDNADLKKKSQESKDALRDFQKTGTDAVNKLGETFGVNTGKIDSMLSVLRGLGLRLQESGNAGTAAFGKMLQGINGVTAGIAGLGLASALATFKLLSSEAENFKNTVAGANLELETTAYIDTYRQVIHDFNRELGEGFAETESGWKKFWGTIGSTMKAYLTSGAAFQGALPGSTTVGVSGANTQQLNTFLTTTQQASDAAARAEELYRQIYAVQRQISDSSVEWARQEREIAEYKRIAYDKTADIATQQEALAKAVELINERYGDEAELRRKLADLQTELNGLAESSVADIDKANQLRIQEEATVARMNNALRELSERQATVTLNAQKEAQARAEALAATQKLAQSRAELAAWGQMASSVGAIATPQAESLTTLGIAVPNLTESKIAIEDWWGTVTHSIGRLKIHFAFDPKDKVAISEDMVNISSDLQKAVSSVADTVGMTIGTLVGDLVTGGDAWRNFANTAVSAFGDMAISVGKLAISTGTATLGIKAALESLNGYAAIAAGVALVALGSALKAGLSNIAGGSYNTSSSVASSTGSYGSSSVGTAFETREINVTVSGKLQADGSVLTAVINNEKKRRNRTT